MRTITLQRMIRAGYLSFRRNVWLSTATILVMVLVLFVLGSLIFIGAFANTILVTLESKIDVSVYFLRDAPEESILAVKHELERLPEVKEVMYVSRTQAFEEFRARHKENALIVDALAEVGDNPLEASLNVKARDPSQYAAVSLFLQQKNYTIVDKINYFENEKIIERLSAILGTVRRSGALLALVLAFIAVLVAFNTVRLAIYTMREEISIMRLVGATSWFIRGPFLINGVLYGAFAAAVTTLAFLPLTFLLSAKIAVLVPGFNLFGYFLANFLEFFGIILVAGITLGTTSSLIAIRRYLNA